MKKTRCALSLVTAFCICIALGGCTSGQEPSKTNPAPSGSASGTVTDTADDVADGKIQNLTISESGYKYDDGYIHYAVAITNPNTEYVVENPVLSIVGKDKNGKIVFSDEWTIGTLPPGSTTYWANQAGNGKVKKSNAIEFSIDADDDDWNNDQVASESIYSIENVDIDKDKWGYYSTTGEITMNTNDSECEKPMIVTILRDKDGNIMTGFSGYVDKTLKQGKPKAFETRAFFKADKPAKYEIYANPWW